MAEPKIDEFTVLPKSFGDFAGMTIADFAAKHYDDGCKNGRSAGKREAFKFLMDVAAEWFVQGKDAEAKLLRDLLVAQGFKE